MKNEKVSIIIPVYNASLFLNDTIKTIQDQTYDNWEAIFVNDCSKDDSVSIIKKAQKADKRIILLENKKNSGAAITRNNGIKYASGRYICFLDADDLWDKDKIERQVDFMKRKHCAFSYHSYAFANADGVPNGKNVIASETLSYKEALKNNIISTITVMFDMEKIDSKLIEMPDLKYVEDTATWWKILRSGYTAYGISDLFSIYRRIPNSNSSNKFKTQKYLWNLYRKEEKLGIFSSIYYLLIKNINATRRRIR